MKIIFLNFWAQYTGGAEHSLIDIISGVAPVHETVLITSESGPLTDAAKHAGCKCVFIPCNSNMSVFKRKKLFFSGIIHIKTLLAFFKYCKKLHKYIQLFDPDVIHGNIPKSHIMLFIVIIAGFRKRAYIHIREIFSHNSFPYFLYLYLFNPKNTSIIAISNEVKRSLPSKLQKKAIVIYNGVIIPSEKHTLKKFYYPPRFLYLGRIVPWKGCELLIDAFEILVKEYGMNAGTLSITGGTFYWDNSYRNFLLKKITIFGLGSQISINDYTSDITSVFLRHSVFCLPSDNEPFGRVAAEAMAHGLPVIGFKSGGLPEVVDNNFTGMLSEKRSCFSLYKLMSKCILNPDLLFQMGINGRKKCIEKFNNKNQIDKIISAIET